MAGRVEELKTVAWRTRDNDTGKESAKGEPVLVPRGEGKVARRLASSHGAQVVGLEFKNGRVSYFDRKGRRLSNPDPLVQWVLKKGGR